MAPTQTEATIDGLNDMMTGLIIGSILLGCAMSGFFAINFIPDKRQDSM